MGGVLNSAVVPALGQVRKDVCLDSMGSKTKRTDGQRTANQDEITEGEDVFHSKIEENSEKQLQWRIVGAKTAINRDLRENTRTNVKRKELLANCVKALPGEEK